MKKPTVSSDGRERQHAPRSECDRMVGLNPQTPQYDAGRSSRAETLRADRERQPCRPQPPRPIRWNYRRACGRAAWIARRRGVEARERCGVRLAQQHCALLAQRNDYRRVLRRDASFIEVRAVLGRESARLDDVLRPYGTPLNRPLAAFDSGHTTAHARTSLSRSAIRRSDSSTERSSISHVGQASACGGLQPAC